jgi:hypothetical protein
LSEARGWAFAIVLLPRRVSNLHELPKASDVVPRAPLGQLRAPESMEGGAGPCTSYKGDGGVLLQARHQRPQSHHRPAAQPQHRTSANAPPLGSEPPLPWLSMSRTTLVELEPANRCERWSLPKGQKGCLMQSRGVAWCAVTPPPLAPAPLAAHLCSPPDRPHVTLTGPFVRPPTRAARRPRRTGSSSAAW